MVASEKKEQPEVLVLPPTRRDGEIALTEFRAAGLRAQLCDSIEPVCACITAGVGGVALLTEDALTPEVVDALRRALAQQPAWSDFPLLVLASARASLRAVGAETLSQCGTVGRFPYGRSPYGLALLGNVTLLDPPLRVRSMIYAVRVALRGRARQFAACSAIEKRDHFLAMLGHELRNPLSAISLALQAVAIDSEKALAVMHRQTAQLTYLVNDLLDVARVSSGRIELRRNALELGGALDQTIEGLREQIERAGLFLECDIERGVVVDGDQARLEQVFGNLLTNALKYTPAGGTVSVTVKREERHARVEVRDTGVGLPAESLQAIFEQFVQVESTLARARGGLGIGLTLARTLVELHGGTIAAQSEGEGLGSLFTVRLPLSASAIQRQGPAAPRHRPAGRVVVVVEDNDDARELLVSLLRELGYKVRGATNGAEGLKLLLEPETEFGVIDIGLPQVDGYEVAARARRARGSALRLVALTGYGQATDRARALGAGFDEHLAKPPDINRLLDALHG